MNSTSTCANCGKDEDDSIKLKTCTACKMVKYCSRDCQITHRPQHKKECKKRAKELHDEKLFEEPPPLEDCPICMIRLPSLKAGGVYMDCCGKVICSGCIYAFQSRATKEEDNKCPFCRTPPPESDEEWVKRNRKRMDMNDPRAIYNLGCCFYQGDNGLPQNYAKALELWQRAGELGGADGYHGIGNAYKEGNGVERNETKAEHYWELAAMGGDGEARHNLGVGEIQKGNINRALKHWMIAVRDGNAQSLESIKNTCEFGFTTKDTYSKALQSYQAYLDEIKTAQRDEAALFKDGYKYY